MITKRRGRPIAYLAMHRIAESVEGDIRRGLRVGIGLARAEITDDMVAAVLAGRLGAVDRAIPWDRVANTLHEPMADGIRDAVVRAAKASALLIPVGAVRKVAPDVLADLGFRFDLTNARALRWARDYAARLVVNITAQTRQSLTQVVVRMYTEGLTVREAAREMRALVGLHPRYALAVDNLRRSLTERGRTPEEATDAAVRYAGQLERSRAMVIARTESMTASNAGQHILWQEATQQGILEPRTVRREWIITPDERLCEICAPVPANPPVGLDTPFTLGDGDQVLYPPAHPQCRCTTRLVFLE